MWARRRRGIRRVMLRDALPVPCSSGCSCQCWKKGRLDRGQPFALPRRVTRPGLARVFPLAKREGGEAPGGATPSSRLFRRRAARLGRVVRTRTPPGASPRRLFRPRAALASSAHDVGSVQQAPRARVIVPVGRSPEAPGSPADEAGHASRVAPTAAQNLFH